MASIDISKVDTNRADINKVVDNAEDIIVVKLFAILIKSKRRVAILVINIVVLKNVLITALTIIIVLVVAIENIVRVVIKTTHSIVPVC